jgi:hypothetical protein
MKNYVWLTNQKRKNDTMFHHRQKAIVANNFNHQECQSDEKDSCNERVEHPL